MKPLPRASGGPVIIDAQVWNDLCDRVEASEISVAYPLQITETGRGRVLSIADNIIVPRVTVVAAATQPGVYTGYRRRAVKQLYDPTRTGLLNADSINDFGEVPEHQDEIYIMNGAEESTNTHALLASGANTSKTHVASPLEMRANDGRLVYYVNGHATKACTTTP